LGIRKDFSCNSTIKFAIYELKLGNSLVDMVG